jgi:hypothetical protein
VNREQRCELDRIISAQSMLLRKPHSFMNQGRTDLNHLVLGVQVELESVDEDVKVGLINITLSVTTGKGGNNLHRSDACYMQTISGGWIA